MVEYQQKDRYNIGDLLDIVRLLRGEGGCPWDREQTHKSIKSDFIEETCEAIEAIEEANKYIDNAQAYKLLAAANSGSGKTAAAIAAYKKYLELDPKAKDANKVMLTIAATAQKAGDKATAVEYYTKLQNDAEFGATAKAQLATLKK